MIDTFASTELGSLMRRSHARPASRKPWWFSSIFNHYVLAVLASVTTIIVTQRGCAPAANREAQRVDNARARSEVGILVSRLQEREQQLARLERECEEQKGLERARQLEQERSERLQRERKRQEEEMERERRHEMKERLEQQQREKQAVQRALDRLAAKIKVLEGELERLRSLPQSQATKESPNRQSVSSSKKVAGLEARASDREACDSHPSERSSSQTRGRYFVIEPGKPRYYTDIRPGR